MERGRSLKLLQRMSWFWQAYWDMMDLPCGPRGTELSCQCRRIKRCWVDSWVGKTSWRRASQLTPVFLHGESHGQRSLEATVHRVADSWTWLKWLSTQAMRLDALEVLIAESFLQSLEIPPFPWHLFSTP